MFLVSDTAMREFDDLFILKRMLNFAKYHTKLLTA